MVRFASACFDKPLLAAARTRAKGLIWFDWV
jgi:hypothetical protein